MIYYFKKNELVVKIKVIGAVKLGEDLTVLAK